MAKSTSSICSIDSPAPSTSSANSSTGSPISTSSISRNSSSALTSDKSLRLKSSSSIDRRKRLAANARERKRMHLLNKAYDELRRRLVDANNKSKYEVLVQAKEYIQALATICEKFDREQQNNPLKQSNQLFAIYQDKNVVEVDIGSQNSPMDMTAYGSSKASTSETLSTNSHTSIQVSAQQQQQHFSIHHTHSTILTQHLNYIQ